MASGTLEHLTDFRDMPLPRWVRASLALLGLLGALHLGGCDEGARNGLEPVTIGSRTFHLELAITEAQRFRGLSERTSIAPDGGMLFVFPDHLVAVQGFVMRDCPIPIDIIYLDGAGRVLSMYAMTPEPPRDPARGEGTPADAMNPIYNARLRQYSSRFPSQFVIELAGGTLETLNIKVGDRVKLDIDRLKRMAR